MNDVLPRRGTAVRLGTVNAAMLQATQLLREMKAEEERLLTRRRTASLAAGQTVFGAIGWGTAISLVLAVVIVRKG